MRYFNCKKVFLSTILIKFLISNPPRIMSFSNKHKKIKQLSRQTDELYKELLLLNEQVDVVGEENNQMIDMTKKICRVNELFSELVKGVAQVDEEENMENTECIEGYQTERL